MKPSTESHKLQLIENSDVNVIYDNHKLTSLWKQHNRSEQAPPPFQDLNDVITDSMCELTSSFRFKDATFNTSLRFVYVPDALE